MSFAHETLHAKTMNAARNEKQAMLELLAFPNEVDRRRTYAVVGYPSLFKYVEVALGYSPAQASERVAAARLLGRVPEVAENLKSGGHTLTSVAKVELPRLERAKALTKERTRLTLDVDEEFMETIRRIREIKGNPGLLLPLYPRGNSARDSPPRDPELWDRKNAAVSQELDGGDARRLRA